MGWESIIKNLVEGNFLQQEGANEFLNNIVRGNISRDLRKKELNVDFVAWLFLYYGYCRRILDQSIKADLKLLKKILRRMDSEVIKQIIGNDKKYILDRLGPLIKTGNIYRCPFHSVTVFPQKGTTKSWEITFFIQYLYMYLDENLKNHEEIKKFMVDILLHFPPWKKSRKHLVNGIKDITEPERKKAWDSIRKYLYKYEDIDKLYYEEKKFFEESFKKTL